MRYAVALQTGRLLRRYKRFFTDVLLDDGREVVVHCPNTGAMTGCAEPGFSVRVSPAANPKRKLQWTLEQTRNHDGVWIGVHTGRVNTLVREALEAGLWSELQGWRWLRNEPRHGDGRFDLLLQNDTGRRMLVEIKSVTLAENGRGLFPDARSQRAARHVEELAAVQRAGELETALIFCVQRADVVEVRPAEGIDPAFAGAVRVARQAGVRLLAGGCELGAEAVDMVRSLPVLADG